PAPASPAQVAGTGELPNAPGRPDQDRLRRAPRRPPRPRGRPRRRRTAHRGPPSRCRDLSTPRRRSARRPRGGQRAHSLVTLQPGRGASQAKRSIHSASAPPEPALGTALACLPVALASVREHGPPGSTSENGVAPRVAGVPAPNVRTIATLE